MLSQIPPGPRTASKNGYFGHLRTVSDRLPSDFMRAGSILTTAGVSKSLLPILLAFSSKSQPVNNPFKTRPDTDRAPRDYFLPIFVNIYNRFLTVSTAIKIESQCRLMSYH